MAFGRDADSFTDELWSFDLADGGWTRHPG